jgi:hypothetical protein
MLIERQPQNAKAYGLGFDKAMKAVSAASHDRLQLAIDSTVASPAASEPTGNDES